jgi:hypothetical protein
VLYFILINPHLGLNQVNLKLGESRSPVHLAIASLGVAGTAKRSTSGEDRISE